MASKGWIGEATRECHNALTRPETFLEAQQKSCAKSMNPMEREIWKNIRGSVSSWWGSTMKSSSGRSSGQIHTDN